MFVRYLRGLGGPLTRDAVLAAICATLAWGPLMRKRISRETVRGLPWYVGLWATLIGASVDAAKHEPRRFCGVANEELLNSWSATELAYLTLIGERAKPAELFAFQVLTGLLISNAVGSISAQGCKGAVSSDGPETPSRVQINKAMMGFLTHTGYSHGGAGYEGIVFLAEQFRDSGLKDPSSAAHGLDLKAMAKRFAEQYAKQKTELKESGAERMRAIAGLNHPVFRDKPVNQDPREAFIHELFRGRGEYNVFHEYYHALARALFEAGVTRNVFCVNIDGVIGALLLKMLWPRYRGGGFSEHDLEVAAFTIFLYGRMIGCAAGDRRPHQPRAQHGYARAGLAVPLRGLSGRDHDVIVIGAGAAGLAAAAELARAGRSVLTVEARDRIGGRCDTRRLPGVAVPVELGAEFIHGRPEATLSLLKQAGIPPVDTTRTQRVLFDGQLRAVDVFAVARKAMRRAPSKGPPSFRAFLARQRLPPAHPRARHHDGAGLRRRRSARRERSGDRRGVEHGAHRLSHAPPGRAICRCCRAWPTAGAASDRGAHGALVARQG